MKLKYFFAAAAMFLCVSVKAQNITPSHLKAADDLLTAARADTLYKQNMATMLNQASGRIPEAQRAKFVTVMNAFMAKYISWELLKDQMAVLYAKEFTEKELKDLTAFYNTPLGKKLNSKQPILLQKGAEMGQLAVQSHQSELEKMMQDAFKEQ
ncbi:DUF2059 domain-containing protein [Mucilaginibacter pallidiroseus]|uniref:DUF2059 domain-containing protein n=1 Tax=Mucilaginibacter pallidiroseus TaxID=2599295 RepID=A0A563UFD9_9SPHI|nr:DUF2059 domain-containing protein [Mucilaginibacter pallidiroseus]TWR29979.1 DUF2059 domain-containing protein [Mucilaginibacter pallidiroseus]